MPALTAYLTSTNDTLVTTARQLTNSAPASEATANNSSIPNGTGWLELFSQGQAGPSLSSSEPVPSGNGFIWDVTTLEGQQILAGNWTPTLKLQASRSLNGNNIVVRAFVRSSGGVFSQIGSDMTLTNQNITTSATVFTFSATSLPSQNFNVGDKLYIDVLVKIINAPGGIYTISLFENGGANEQVVTPGYAANVVANAPPEVNLGPPSPGSPRLQRLAAEPTLQIAPSPPGMATFAAEYNAGPPLRGSPLSQRLPIDHTLQTAAPGPVRYRLDEVNAGPPLRGSPLIQRLPIEPANNINPPVVPTTVPFLLAETNAGPPLRGAPWQQNLPVDPLASLASSPAPVPVPASVPLPPTHGGPPIPGAPWSKLLIPSASPSSTAAGTGISTGFPEVNSGPPLRGAPWLARLPFDGTGIFSNAPPAPGLQRFDAEINGGPPQLGVPFIQRLPIEPSNQIAPPPIVPTPRNALAEVNAGPPLRGAPWAQRLPIDPLAALDVATPVAAGGQTYSAEVNSGPGLRGAPWLQRLPTAEPLLQIQGPAGALPPGKPINLIETFAAPLGLGSPYAPPIQPSVVSGQPSAVSLTALAEVNAGPPMVAPWSRLTIALPVTSPAPVPVPVPVPVPEIHAGPLGQGSPFGIPIAIQPSALGSQPSAGSPIGLAEVNAGPPLRGAPWLQRLPIDQIAALDQVQGPVFTRTYAPEVNVAPPIGGPFRFPIQQLAQGIGLPTVTFGLAEVRTGPLGQGSPFGTVHALEPQQRISPLPAPSAVPVPVVEVNAGPPQRGSPWLQILPLQPAVAIAGTAAGSAINLAEITTGPPLRGAPWLGRLPVDPIAALDQAAPPAVTRIYGPEIHAGPLGQGSPFGIPIAIQPTVNQGSGVGGQGSGITETTAGPPLGGAPWARLVIQPSAPGAAIAGGGGPQRFAPEASAGPPLRAPWQARLPIEPANVNTPAGPLPIRLIGSVGTSVNVTGSL